MEALLIQFDLHHRLFNNVLEGFDDQEANRRLHDHPHINPVIYLAGHLLNSQYGLAVAAGLNPEVKWNDLFAVMGQSEARDNYPYPTLGEILQEWNALHKPLKIQLGGLSSDQLKEKPPAPFDQVASSRGELWAFISHHIAYHIGQIGLLRRGFGKAPMRYD